MMMMHLPCRIVLRALAFWFCLLSLMLPATSLLAQEARRNQMRMRKAEPNVLAPELYLEHLKLKLTLIDLPGASDPRSYWEGTYQLYFVSEAEHEKVIMEMVRSASTKGGASAFDLSLSTFPKKILLAEGNFKQSGLAALKDRTFILEQIPFRSKIPESERTKEGRLLLSCNVKIFDARLKQNIYRTRMWDMQAPLMEAADQPERDVARTTVYSNFYVTKTGDVYESQWTREGDSTSW
ncbi:MAG: hypothetical protein ICV60_01835 [Pyrinomonadaceae bacterium]|nr:hypothetical protein [Pyrinomonadaceae bacterium]